MKGYYSSVYWFLKRLILILLILNNLKMNMFYKIIFFLKWKQFYFFLPNSYQKWDSAENEKKFFFSFSAITVFLIVWGLWGRLRSLNKPTPITSYWILEIYRSSNLVFKYSSGPLFYSDRYSSFNIIIQVTTYLRYTNVTCNNLTNA